MPILYCQWHYVTIWGRRKGKYSKIALRYRFLFPMANILPYLKMWVTIKTGGYWDYDGNGVGVEYLISSGGWGVGWGYPYWTGWQVGTQVANVKAHLTDITLDPANIPSWIFEATAYVTAVGGDTPHLGETLYSEFPYDYASKHLYIDCSPWFDVLTSGPTYINFGIAGHEGDWIAAGPGGSDWSAPFTAPASGLSFWVAGDTPYNWAATGPHREYVDLKGRQATWGYPFNIVDTIIVFHDGGQVYNQGYIAFRLIDPDHGIFEIWAKCAGRWYGGKIIERNRDETIYFGPIELCNNHGDEEHLTYHGFLPISLLDLT
jgi:hypothetical protein